MKKSVSAFVFLLLSATGASVLAADFKSVGADPTIMYNAPSDRGRKVFIAPRGMPVQIVLNQDGWSKVRDASGDLSWVDSKALTTKRMVVVTAANAKMHTTAADASAVVATIDKNVLLELAAPAAAGWVKVKHQDGASGFVKTGEVWGE